jgi:hypothetical protein
MKTPKSDSTTIIEALRVLARDTISEDGIVPCCLMEAADRIEELERARGEAKKQISSLLRPGVN